MNISMGMKTNPSMMMKISIHQIPDKENQDDNIENEYNINECCDIRQSTSKSNLKKVQEDKNGDDEIHQ